MLHVTEAILTDIDAIWSMAPLEAKAYCFPPIEESSNGN